MAENVYHQRILSDQKTSFRAGQSSSHAESKQQLHPTAYRPPLYPLLLVLGVASPVGFETSVILLHLLLGLLTVWLTVKLGSELGLGRSALLAGAFVALDPILLHHSTLVMTETLATFFTVLALWLLVKATVGENSTSTKSELICSTLAGATLGLGALCRPTFLVCLLAAALLLWIAKKHSKVRYRAIGLYLLASLIVLSPWVMRNQRLYGRPIIATTHGGYTFHLANNPGFYEYLRSGSWGEVWTSDEPFTLYPGSSIHTSMTDYPNRRLQDPSMQISASTTENEFQKELLLDRLHYQDAWQAIRAEPGMFLWSLVVRIGRFWQPLPHTVSRKTEQAQDSTAASVAAESTLATVVRYLIAVWYVGLYVLAALGMWSLGKQGWQAPWVWAVLLVICFLAVHAFYWTDMRMRAPIMPVLALMAAVGVGQIRQLTSHHKSPTVNHLRKQNGT